LEQGDERRDVLGDRLPNLHARYLPSNRGSRFSRKARMPSSWS